MPREDREILLFVISLVVPVILVLGLGWANLRLVKAFSIGSQFDASWQAARLFALRGESPYFRDFLPVQPASVPKPSVRRFTAPFYSLFLFLPFALIEDVQTARAVWMVTLEIALFLIGIGILQALDWKPHRLTFAVFLITAIFGYHSIQSVITGSTAALAILFIMAGLSLLRKRRLELAGIFFALATIQPRLMFLPAIFLLFWAFSLRSWQLVVWFLGGVAVLSLTGVIFIPDWPLQYLRVLWNIRDVYSLVTPISAFKEFLPGIGRQLGAGLMLLSGLFLLVEWLFTRKKEIHWFLWTFSLTLVLSSWVGIPSALQDYVAFLLPLGLVVSVLEKRLGRLGEVFGFLVLVVYLILWWLFFSRLYAVNTAFRLQSQFLWITPLFFVGLLIWVRWWATRLSRSYLFDVRSLIQ